MEGGIKFERMIDQMNSYRIKVFERASVCRNFEEIVFSKVKERLIQYPVYLSAGQEFISATVAQYVF